MNLYFELLKKPVFNMEDVNVFYKNMKDVYKRQTLICDGPDKKEALETVARAIEDGLGEA